MKVKPVSLVDLWGLYCQIEWGDPYLGGDPLGLRYEEETVGYIDAVLRKLLWEYSLNRLLRRLKLSITVPVPSPDFEYYVYFTIYQEFKEYIRYYEVCYDDCTNEEISKKDLSSGETGKTGEVILKEWAETFKLPTL